MDAGTGRFLIADVVALTGVSAPQLRSWERAGLLRPERSGRAVRVYGVEDVARVRLFRRLLDNPGRRGSLRRLAALLDNGEVRPEARDYAGLEAVPAGSTEALAGVTWQSVLDAMAEFVLVADGEGALAYANSAMRVAMEWGDGLPPTANVAGATLPMRWTARTGQPQHDVLITSQNGDGSDARTHWNVAPLRGRGGTALGAVAVGRDITVERGLAQAREDQLAAAAHDLRSPVTSILGHIQLAQRVLALVSADDGSSDDAKPAPDGSATQLGSTKVYSSRLPRVALHLNAAERGTRALLRAMETLLDATAAAAGGLVHQLEAEDVNLVEVARQAIAAARSSTTRHTFALEVAEEPVVVVGDPIRLYEVLDNLISNAVKYSPDGGQVTVRLDIGGEPLSAIGGGGLANANGWATLRVSDEGIGIPADDVPHVFDRYRRASGAARGFRGSGLGLYTCRAIVMAHGGHIWIERTATADDAVASGRKDHDSEWHGSVISVTLPLAPKEVA